MLEYVYHVAFDAKAETVSWIYAERQAVIEGFFVGTHIGEFAGSPATGRIVRGRVYLQPPVLLKQLGTEVGSAAGAH